MKRREQAISKSWLTFFEDSLKTVLLATLNLSYFIILQPTHVVPLMCYIQFRYSSIASYNNGQNI